MEVLLFYTRITEPPRFAKSEETKSVIEFRKLELMCSASGGDEPITYKWEFKPVPSLALTATTPSPTVVCHSFNMIWFLFIIYSNFQTFDKNVNTL